MIITVLKCEVCSAIVARIEHPKTAKLDSSCDIEDHVKSTKHSNYTALKHLIVYMCQADKDLADAVSEKQRDAFDRYMDTFKAKFKI